MKQGYLSQYFNGVAMKYLSAVEADPNRSNQHEFNGVGALHKLFGQTLKKISFSTRFVYLTDSDDEPVTDEGFLTWYDARQKAREERGVMRSEYRLYFPSNLVSQCSAKDDLLLIARKVDDSLLCIIAENGSTIAQQLLWLFGFSDSLHPGFSVKSELETEQDRIGFASRVILEQIGIDATEEEPSFLDQMLGMFEGKFPTTLEFSAYARSTVKEVNSLSDPDAAVMAWMEREEILFRTLEKHILGEKLHGLIQQGEVETEPFMKIALSTLQTRRSRAGAALENHMEQVFREHGIQYTRQGLTEKKHKPDFMFPSISDYHNKDFPVSRLTMLASKTTCKDRWRQILNEAERIQLKHLLSLEPSISESQTLEMQHEQVQLILPAGLHNTYTQRQQHWLMNVSSFLELVKSRQSI